MTPNGDRSQVGGKATTQHGPLTIIAGEPIGITLSIFETNEETKSGMKCNITTMACLITDGGLRAVGIRPLRLASGILGGGGLHVIGDLFVCFSVGEPRCLQILTTE